MLISFFLFLLIFVSLAKLSLPYILKFLLAHGMTAENYKQDIIPVGLGIYLWFLLIAYYMLLQLWSALDWRSPFDLVKTEIDPDHLSTYVLLLTVIFIVGWLDDSLGDKRIKGFRGHWRKWSKERVLTSGFLKAAVTGILAVWAVFIELDSSLGRGAIQVLLLALMTNAMNLLDLRPGRALKGFLACLFLLFVWGKISSFIIYLLPVAAGALFVLPQDLRAHAMLGDTGVNFLGFALGYCIVVSAPWGLQLTLLVLLVLLHWYVEHGSITKVIERNKILRWIDRLGRA